MEKSEWNQEYDDVLVRIKKDDEDLKCIVIGDDEYDDGNVFNCPALVDFTRRNPDAIVEAFSENSTIQSIFIRVCDMSQHFEEFDLTTQLLRPIQVLATLFGSLSSLVSLRIVSSNDPMIRSLAQFLEQQDHILEIFFREIRQIKTLELMLLKFHRPQSVDQALQGHPSLETLKYNILDDGSRSQTHQFPFQNALSTIPKLRTLTFHPVANVGSRKPIKLCGFPVLRLMNNHDKASTRTITFYLCTLDQQGSASLAASLEINNNLNVEGVYFPANRSSFDRIAATAKVITEMSLRSSPRLRTRNPTYNRNCSQGLEQILDNSLPSGNLKYLSILGFEWEQEHLNLLQSILVETSSLLCLAVDFYGVAMNDDAWLAFASSVGCNTTIGGMNLQMPQRKNAFSVEGLRRGHAQIARNPKLKVYHFKWKHAVAQNLVDLINVCANDNSRILIVGFKTQLPFDAAGQDQIVSALSKNHTLGILYVSGFCDGVDAKRPYYRSLSVQEPGMRHGTAEIVHLITTLNLRGRQYLVEDLGCRVAGVNLLAQICAYPINFHYKDGPEKTPRTVDLRLDSIFFHLRENPSLCNVPCIGQHIFGRAANTRGKRPASQFMEASSARATKAAKQATLEEVL